MKKLTVQLGLLSLLALPFAATAADSYQLDPNHTYVMWHAQHFGFSTQTGKFRATGTLLLDEKNIENSKVNVKIKMADLATGVPEFDKHLQRTLFFNVSKFPEATFVSEKIAVVDAEHVDMTGTLTFLGVKKPLTLAVTLNKKGVSPLNDKYTMGFTAKTEIKRSDFGMNALIPNISEQVPIDIQVEAIKDGQ